MRLISAITNKGAIVGFEIIDEGDKFIIDYSNAVKYCSIYKIEGINSINGILAFEPNVKIKSSRDVKKLRLVTFEELEISRSKKVLFIYRDTKFFGTVTVRAKVKVENNKVAYVVSDTKGQVTIITKVALGLLALNGQAIGCKAEFSEKYNNGVAIYTDAPYIDIINIPFDKRVVYNIIGEITDISKPYELVRLEFDRLKRLSKIVIDKGTNEGGIQKYKIDDYLSILKGEVLRVPQYQTIRRYPYIIKNNISKLPITKLLPYDSSISILGSKKVIINNETEATNNELPFKFESMEDCIKLREKLDNFIDRHKKGDIKIKIKPTDSLECIGFLLGASKNNRGNIQVSRWNIAFILNGEYILLPYNVVTRSAFAKRLNIGFDGANVDLNRFNIYDIGNLYSIKGYREYDIDTEVTTIYLDKELK